MRECWLRPNRRVLSLGFVPAAALAAAGAVMLLSVNYDAGWGLLHYSGVALTALGAAGAGAVVTSLVTPRLAYRDGELLVYLGGGPQRIPIRAIERFFPGEKDALLPSPGAKTKTAVILVRVADAAKEWHRGAARPALGEWQDGYITIRGAWCEPIDCRLLERLNERLLAAHREAERRSPETV